MVYKVMDVVTSSLTRNQPDAFKDTQVLRYGGLGYSQKACQSIDTQCILITLTAEELYQPETSRVGEYGKNCRLFFGVFFKRLFHLVYKYQLIYLIIDGNKRFVKTRKSNGFMVVGSFYH